MQHNTTMLLRPFTLKGHRGVLCGLAVTPDGKLQVHMGFDQFNPPARHVDAVEARAGKFGKVFERRNLMNLGEAFAAAGV